MKFEIMCKVIYKSRTQMDQVSDPSLAFDRSVHILICATEELKLILR